MKSKNYVITTVNPFGDLENQVACFNSWKQIGYQIKSYNAKKEADLLKKSGFLEEDIQLISEDETTFSQNEKYLPRVKPILEKLALSDDDFILTNSDIYAFHAIPLMRTMGSIAPCIAFTRRELLLYKQSSIRDNEYYRGGLDLFYVSNDVSKRLVGELRNCVAADEMAFGVPGWDYVLGALIKSRLGGIICDGPIVGHKYHKNTYSNVNSFNKLARDVARVMNFTNTDPYNVADNFACTIDQDCQRNARVRYLLNNFYHKNNSNKVNENCKTDDIEIHDINGLLAKTCQQRLKTVLAKVRSENDWGLANQFIPGCFIRTTPFTQKLFTLWNYLKANDLEGRVPTRVYPQGNLHSVAIKNCLKLPEPDQNNAIFDVFVTELINHNIFNEKIFDYLALSSTSQTQLDILARIKVCIGVI